MPFILFFFFKLNTNDLDSVLVIFRANYGIRPWREEGPKEAISYSRITSSSSNSRVVHPKMQEVRQKFQKACVDEQRAPGKTQT